MSEELCLKRLEWFNSIGKTLVDKNKSDVENAYEIFIEKLGIKREEAPIVEKSDERIVIHSKNFCPTLEACKILNLDTRYICSELNEKPMDLLIKAINPDLHFSRNYEKLRPYAEFCEEEILIKNGL